MLLEMLMMHLIIFLNEEVIFNRDCPVCLSKHNTSLEKRVVVAGKYLIINLKRYLLNDGGWMKEYESGEMCYWTVVFFCRLR